MNQLFKNHIMKVLPIAAGATREKQAPEAHGRYLYKLSSNENLLGPSPKAMEAIRANLHLLNEYDFQNDEQLRGTLARHFDWALLPEQFVTANGGAELLDIICRAFLEPGDECILSTPTFLAYKGFASLQGATVIDVPLTKPQFNIDITGILQAVNERTRLIFITNPNNPTGTIIPRAAVNTLLQQLPAQVVVVYDEVYYNYVDDENFAPAQEFIQKGYQVIGLHSFSKVYGMAGLRLGYAFSTPDIAAYLHRFKRPFMINTLSMAAAIAALGDHEHLALSTRLVKTEKKWLYNQLNALTIPYWPSEANYILFRSPVVPTEVLKDEMLVEGIMVRPGEAFGISNCIRVTVGTRDANKAFMEALKKIQHKYALPA